MLWIQLSYYYLYYYCLLYYSCCCLYYYTTTATTTSWSATLLLLVDLVVYTTTLLLVLNYYSLYSMSLLSSFTPSPLLSSPKTIVDDEFVQVHTYMEYDLMNKNLWGTWHHTSRLYISFSSLLCSDALKLQVHDQMIIDMFLRPLFTFSILILCRVSKALFISCIYWNKSRNVMDSRRCSPKHRTWWTATQKRARTRGPA